MTPCGYRTTRGLPCEYIGWWGRHRRCYHHWQLESPEEALPVGTLAPRPDSRGRGEWVPLPVILAVYSLREDRFFEEVAKRWEKVEGDVVPKIDRPVLEWLGASS